MDTPASVEVTSALRNMRRAQLGNMHQRVEADAQVACNRIAIVQVCTGDHIQPTVTSILKLSLGVSGTQDGAQTSCETSLESSAAAGAAGYQVVRFHLAMWARCTHRQLYPLLSAPVEKSIFPGAGAFEILKGASQSRAVLKEE